MTDPLLAELLAMEEQVRAALEAGDAEADRNPISPDFLSAYRSGFAACDRLSRRLPPDGTDETMFVSSIWRRAGESWANIFSQDTMAD